MKYDVLNKDLSYMYGWFAGDGGLYNTTRNRGKLQTEISFEDKDIIYKLESILSSMQINSSVRTRTRDTNYKLSYKSISLAVYSLDFRTFFIDAGFEKGCKTTSIAPPTIPFDEKSFARGYIDADGSFCIGRTHNIPILSICISSEKIYLFFIKEIEKVCGYTPNLTRNKRDNVYNLQVTRKNVLDFIDWLGYDIEGEISLDRKKYKALELVNKYKTLYK